MTSTITKYLIFSLTLFLMSCGNIDDKCKSYAEMVNNAVTGNDTKLLAEADSLFRSGLAADSLNSDEWRNAMTDYADDYGNDTVSMAIKIIAEIPSKLGAEMVDRLISHIDDAPKEEFIRTLGISRYIYSSLQRYDDFMAFNSAYQKGIDTLPIEKQMQIYASIATPEMLGEVLADDVVSAQGTPAADSVAANVNSRIQALKKIYSTDDYEKLKVSFGKFILSTDASSVISSFNL